MPVSLLEGLFATNLGDLLLRMQVIGETVVDRKAAGAYTWPIVALLSFVQDYAHVTQRKRY